MISLKLLLYLSIGTAAMLIPIMIQGAWYGIKWYKRITIAVLLTVAGTIGTYILFFIENGWIGGTSFFGAVFFVPLLFFPVAKLLHLPYGKLMDICAPAECIMLVVMKVQCLISGCCEGRTISFAGKNFVFPSQIAEMANAVILLVLLMIIAKSNKQAEKIYPLYMMFYSVSRFILNIFREEWVTTEMFVPYGNIWSVVVLLIGIIWIIILERKSETKIKPF